MNTERPSPRYAEIDSWDPADTLEAMIEGQFGAVAAVRAARLALEQAAKAMEARLRYRGRLIYVGAGTSGRLAVAGRRRTDADLQLAARTPGPAHGGRRVGVHAIDRGRGGSGRSGAFSWSASTMSTPRMSLMAVAASGTTPFTLACLREAKRWAR